MHAATTATAPTTLLRRLLPALLILLWLAVAAVGGPKFGEISEVATNDQSSFLPESAESTQVGERLADFQDSGAAPAIVVLTGQDDTSLDPATVAGLADLPDRLIAAVDGLGEGTGTEASPPIPSEDGEAVQLIVLPPEGVAPADAVDALNSALGRVAKGC